MMARVLWFSVEYINSASTPDVKTQSYVSREHRQQLLHFVVFSQVTAGLLGVPQVELEASARCTEARVASLSSSTDHSGLD